MTVAGAAGAAAPVDLLLRPAEGSGAGWSVTLRGPTVSQDFQKLVIDYIERRYGVGNAGRTAAE